MINWRLLSHPVNWLNVGAILVFWLVAAYLVAMGLGKVKSSNKSNEVN